MTICGRFLIIIFVIGVIAFLSMSCSRDEPISVEEAKRRGYQREIEPCIHQQLYPKIYKSVAFERLDGGLCAFYYP